MKCCCTQGVLQQRHARQGPGRSSHTVAQWSTVQAVQHSYSALPSLRDSRRPTAIELVNSGPCHVCATPPPAVTEDTSLTRGALLRCPRSCEPPDDALAVTHNTSCGEFHDQLHVCVNARTDCDALVVAGVALVQSRHRISVGLHVRTAGPTLSWTAL